MFPYLISVTWQGILNLFILIEEKYDSKNYFTNNVWIKSSF
jgi:hypothetical protein